MPTVLITGISGQDGSYLAEQMLAKGYRVIGAVRDENAAAGNLPAALQGNVDLLEWDMADQRRMEDVLDQYRPDEIYNFAAYSSGAGMFDAPLEIGDVNGLAVVRMLEAIRAVDVGIRFCQASSREIFGEALESPLTETSTVNARSPYGAAKYYADTMLRIYRQRYGMFACSAILFNHESPRRGLGFVTRRITNTAAKIKLGMANELQLGNLDAQRDWSYAGDAVNAMWLMLQHDQADDYVVASGTAHTVREFCEHAFAHLGLDYRVYVREDKSLYRPAEPALLIGDARKAETVLGWKPQVGFEELVRMMVDSDVQELRKFKN